MTETTFRIATEDDVRAVRAVRAAAADDLTRRFGGGHWSSVSTLGTIRRHVAAGVVHVAEQDRVIATFTLSPQKISFYSRHWFAHPEDPALYLTSMAVDPDWQRRGLGRRIMDHIEAVARAEGCRAVRFDAYDAAAGAGRFYEKCGYARVHKGAVGSTALEYFEKVLG